jgi:simple sugar transport system substrate-binding protein
VKAKVAALEKDIIAGKFHPFTGPVKDQSGKERVAAGAVMTDKDMGVMDFYVEGIQGSLPKKQ